ncbi:hypothetical protein TRIATDRAFT_53348 [Trichoderma atroviride IMI 206040]|uniref:Peptidase S8/S53 domain-containing protein n=2 Tax=Hypocrea atroviridis TaxID=63577 RepID=G9NL06_HYPAI|nr:uncharacterized protein TRIATDRAFT_53348 [Trichoderma atroviride IMI 206040]EHK48574.1 hypothetical protein TRIATDRAFT_53348 [Trichoderma atroviride IMI 206040]
MFIQRYILPLPNNPADDITLESDPLKRNVRIAVLDTGFCVDDGDELVKGGEERVIRKRNFFSADEHAHIDNDGHGTHVVGLLLRFAPRAKIIVAKISNSKHEVAGNHQIVEALTWVSSDECRADIIVLSFGLGQNPNIKSSIKGLVEAGKIIFAAASNDRGNEPRAFPASQDGVFGIHVSDGKGNRVGMTPAPVRGDNFSTLGNAIDSWWDGEDVYISGSSFATPVAAAIAANALEFIRHNFASDRDCAKYFYTPLGMRELFRCLSDRIDGYDYVKPWKKHLWDNETQPEDTCSALRDIKTYGAQLWIELWIEKTSEASFQGFEKPRRYSEYGGA